MREDRAGCLILRVGGEQVAARGDQLQVRARDQLCQLTATRRGHEPVLEAVDDQHRQPVELGQPGAGVVKRDRAQLRVERERRGRVGHPAIEVLGHAIGPVGERRGCVQGRRHEREAAPRAEQRAHRRGGQQPPGRRTAAPAGRGAGQDQGAHALAVVERQVLGDHAAHRCADDVCALDAGGVEHRHGVVGQAAHREPSPHRRGASRTAVVEQDHPVLAGQPRQQPVPKARAGAEAHDQHDGVSGRVRLERSLLAPGDPSVARAGLAHTRSLTG